MVKKLLTLLIILTVAASAFTGCAKPADETTPDQSQSLQSGNSSGNYLNDGFFAAQGDWIYYSNFGDNRYLYKIRSDGTGKTRLSTKKCMKVSAIGDWIYYIDIDSRLLYKIQTDGSGEELLFPHTKFGSVYITGGWIYYTTNKADSALYKIRTDGSGKKKIVRKDVVSFCVAGNKIYYTLSKGLYSADTDGKDSVKLLDDILIICSVNGNWIYYHNLSKGSSLWKVKTDGSGNTEIYGGAVRSVNVTGEWVFYTDDKTMYLYKIRTDGTGRKQLNSGKTAFICIAGDWVYFRYIHAGKDQCYKIKTDGTGMQPV